MNLKTNAVRTLGAGDWCVSGQEKVKWALGDPKECEVVRRIFNGRSNGSSLISIAERLNHDEIPCPKRGRWRNSDQKWSTVTIKTTLENPAYYGARIYNRNSMSRILARHRDGDFRSQVRYPHWRNPEDRWILTENAHPPIIDKELWTRANQHNRTKASLPESRPHRKVPYLLTGLIRCGNCGFAYQGQSTRAKRRSYFRYICGGYNAKRVCTYSAIDKEELEKFVIKAIRESMDVTNFGHRILKHMNEILRSERRMVSSDLQRIAKAIRDKEIATRNLAEAIAKCGGSDALLHELQAAEKEKRDLEFQLLVQRSQGHDLDTSPELPRLAEEFLRDLSSGFEALTIEEKRVLIRKCVAQLIVDRESNTVNCYVRKVPLLTLPIQSVYGEVEKCKKATLLESPFRRVEVAGTGTSDSAKLFQSFFKKL